MRRVCAGCVCVYTQVSHIKPSIIKQMKMGCIYYFSADLGSSALGKI
jgi:hypothetical protein